MDNTQSQVFLTHGEVEELARHAAQLIKHNVQNPKIYAVPRGGVPAAYMMLNYLQSGLLVDEIGQANVIVDDLIDSGRTMNSYCEQNPNAIFVPLLDKRQPEWSGKWVVFPWETVVANEDNSIVGTIVNRLKKANCSFRANDNIAEFIDAAEMPVLEDEVARRAEHLLAGLVIDTTNDHNTKGTAKRLAKMYCREIFRGRYEKSPAITDFPNAKHLDEVYTTGPISIRSCCSHHMCPIVGKAWIGIVPGNRVIGLSKFNRIIDWICSRPQIQEELVIQIADHLEYTIQPKGLAVVVEATHTCMTWRGVKETDSAVMKTSVMRGTFLAKPEARAEFFALIKG